MGASMTGLSFSGPFNAIGNNGSQSAFNPDGSLSMVIAQPAVGIAITGTAPTIVSGVGTSAGVFYSIVAPNGGASSAAAGGAGGSISETTGNAGASATGGANGGDRIINLGAGSGTGRAGSLILAATVTNLTSAHQKLQSNTFNITEPTGSNYSHWANYGQVILNGVGSDYSGNNQTALYYETVNNTSGTLAVGSFQGVSGAVTHASAGTLNYAWAGEFYLRVTGSGNIVQGVGVQGTLDMQAGSIGIAWCVGAGLNSNPWGGIISYVYGFANENLFNRSDVYTSPGVSIHGGYTAAAAQFTLPIQSGNTSNTNSNFGIVITGAGQASGAGGSTNNWGIYIDSSVATVAAGAGTVSNWAIYSDTVAVSHFAGNIVIGSHTQQLFTALRVDSTTLAGTTQFGILSNPTFSSSATTAGYVYWGRVQTAAASLTMPLGVVHLIQSPSLGAGSAVTSLAGIQIQNQGVSGVANAFGLWIYPQSGAGNDNTALMIGTAAPAGNWSIYSSSANASSLLGSLAIGTNTAPAASTLTLADGFDLVFGTSDGTMIGTAATQLISLYGAEPIVQRSGSAQAAVVTTGSSLAAYGYTTAAQADSIVTLVNELRAWAVAFGAIKGSA